MTINYENRTIEMTKTEAKEAGKYNSDKYNELKEIRKDFPDFRIVTKSSSRKRDTYKGLTYAYMLNYITKHAKEDDVRMKEFERLRGYEDGKKNELAEIATYGEVKAWFLLNFPEIEEYNKETEKLRKKIKEENENKKVA